jgi:hypothetical protein
MFLADGTAHPITGKWLTAEEKAAPKRFVCCIRVLTWGLDTHRRVSVGMVKPNEIVQAHP